VSPQWSRGAGVETDRGVNWQVGVRHDDAVLGEIADEWAALYARCPSATPFQSPAWLSAWWRHYGRPGGLRMAVVRRDGRLVALGPFHVVRRVGVGVLVPLGEGLSDWTDVLVDPEHTPGAREHLAGALLSVRGWQVLDLPEVRCDAAALSWVQTWPGAVRREEGSMCTELAARPFDEVVSAMPNSSTRQSTRRSVRRMDAAGLTERALAPGEAAEGVRGLLALHEQQWRDRGGMTPEHGRPRFAALLADAAPEMIARGQAVLTAYELGGRLVAAELTLVGAGVTGGYLYGALPELFGRFNVTAMLMRTALTTATAAGAGTFSMLRGRETYKGTWQAHEAPNVRLLLGRPGSRAVSAYAGVLRGRAALAGAARERTPAVKAGLLRARTWARNPALARTEIAALVRASADRAGRRRHRG